MNKMKKSPYGATKFEKPESNLKRKTGQIHSPKRANSLTLMAYFDKGMLIASNTKATK